MLYTVLEIDLISRRLGRPDGRVPRGNCLAISIHLSNRGVGTAPPRWGGETWCRGEWRWWRRILHAAPADTLCRIWLAYSLTVPHPSLSGASSLTLLFPFLTSALDLGAWPDCWVSVEFLHAPISRKGSGNTTTTTVISVHQFYRRYSISNSIFGRYST